MAICQAVTIISNNQWKASSTLSNGWFLPDFDDSSWAFAVSPAPNGVTTVVNGAQSMWVNGTPLNAYFRRSFNLPGNVSQASMEITADNAYKVYVNGVLIAEDVAMWTSKTYNIAGRLRCGFNVIAIHGIEWTAGTPSLVSCRINITATQIQPATTVAPFICQGEQFNGLSQTGVYRDTFPSAGGCDSIVVTDLTVWPGYNREEWVVLCPGQSYAGYSAAGVYRDTFESLHGCDSIIIRHLSAGQVSSSEEWVEICKGLSHAGYTSTGIYRDTFVNQYGCDSIIIRHLTVLDAPEIFEEATICEGESYRGYSESGVFVQRIPAPAGCDSLRIITLAVLSVPVVEQSAVICSGESLYGYMNTGVYTDTFLSQNGCDSLRTLHLTVAENHFTWKTVSICEGESFEGYAQPGIFRDTLRSAEGCDSIRVLALSKTALYIPNAFSPNDDGINDDFRIYSGDPNVEIRQLMIFDRWGAKVFETRNLHIGHVLQWWDGTFNGKKLQAGVYAYVLEITCTSGVIRWSGEVNLIR